MSDYITDPDLLKQLGAPGGSEYVADPALLAQLQGGTSVTTPPVNATENVAAQAPMVATGAAQSLLSGPATANARDALTIAKNATSWTPNAIMEVASHPVETAKAYVAGHPWANTPVKTLAGTVGKNIAGSVVQGLVAPENLLTLPYNMAAYEQAKIRANPTAPGLENNPYAQTVRGEFKTQGQAGAANARQAVANQQYGGLNTQEQAILAADRERQRTAARQVLQQPPTSQNFMQRMQALSDLFGGAAQ